jgi:hypothetical protein
MNIKEYLKRTLVMTRGQYFLNFLLGLFAGCVLMFMFALQGLI